ncbi:MAG: hypothetical protein HY331_00140 [Chloroflexi bacterium]|nr:hypothetical protein [Chloroflexota bacterium]
MSFVAATGRTQLSTLTTTQLEAALAEARAHDKSLPDSEHIHAFFESLSRDEVAAFADALRARLMVETGMLDRFLADGLDPLVEDTQLVLPFSVVRVSEDELATFTPYAGRSRACYSGGVIYAAPELPRLRARLITFAERGVLGHDLMHETYHGFQDDGGLFASPADLVEELLRGGPTEARVALLEAHAWFCCLPGFRDEVLIAAIAGAYHVDRRELLVEAFRRIRELVALAYSNLEIAGMVGAARWDPDAGCYPRLDAAVEQAAALQGIDAGDLADLLNRQRLIHRIEAVRAMGIAREMTK